MEINVTRLSDKEIGELQQKLAQEIDRRAVEKRREALLAAEATAEKYGFELRELLAEFRKPKQKRATCAKYRHPEQPELTWTGMGRKPKWVIAAVQLGHSLEDMRIQ